MADDQARHIGLARPAGYAFVRQDSEELALFPKEVVWALQVLRKKNKPIPAFLLRAEDILKKSGELPSTLENRRPRRLRPSRREEIVWRVASMVSLGHSKRKAIEAAADYYGIGVDTVKREFARQKKLIKCDEEVLELFEIDETGEVSVFVSFESADG